MALNPAFGEQVRAWAEAAKERTEQFVSEFLQDLSEEVVRTTPWKTGNLRSHWTASIGAPGQSAPGNVAGFSAVAASVQIGQTYYFTNGAAYAARLEYGFVGQDSLGRNYNQAPRAWVRTAVARAPQIAEDVAARLRGSA
jgi:hypothetical protein